MPSVKERYKPDIPNYAYLKLPVDEKAEITEGFIYSSMERSLHGMYFHKGIDYEESHGAPVYACASGYATASYHRYTLRNDDGTFRLLDNKPLGNGFGYFVQIYHPEEISKVPGGRITQYGHLSRIAPDINIKITPPKQFSVDEIIEDIKMRNNRKTKNKLDSSRINKQIKQTREITNKYPWVLKRYGYNFSKEIDKKESYLYTPSQLKQRYEASKKDVTWVEQGELIGYIGVSALIWGELKYDEADKHPNLHEFEAWDPDVHLHFEEAIRDTKTGLKHSQRDPYGIYLSVKHYQDRNNYEDLLFNI